MFKHIQSWNVSTDVTYALWNLWLAKKYNVGRINEMVGGPTAMINEHDPLTPFIVTNSPKYGNDTPLIDMICMYKFEVAREYDIKQIFVMYWQN